MLRDNRAQAALIGFENGQQVNQTKPERRSRDVKRGRTGQPRRDTNIGGTAYPRQRDASAIVDCHRNRIGRGVSPGQAPIEEIKKIARCIRSTRQRASGVGIHCHRDCDARQSGGRAIEIPPDLLLDARLGRCSSQTKPPDLEQDAGNRRDQSERQASQEQAFRTNPPLAETRV
jgi:hypothetical protein